MRRMAKVAKILMAIFMIIGIFVSVSNYFSTELNALLRAGMRGEFLIGSGGAECVGSGDDCDI